MPRTLTLAAFAALCTLALTCKKDPPVVPPNGNNPKDPRTYTWTVDTITYPGSFQTAMRSIWASGPANAYIVGHNDNPGTPTMFRYDGTRWRTTNFHASAGGSISGAVSLSKIHGFGPSDVWVAGERIYQVGNTFPDSSFLMHFNGSQWTEALIVGGRGRRLQSLWGANPTDIWAAGTNTLLHYDGVQWSHFPIELPGQGIQFLSIVGMSSNDVYMVGSREDVVNPIDTLAYFLYRFSGVEWSVVDSSIWTGGPPPNRFGVILGTVGNTLYSAQYGVFKRVGGDWQQVLTVTWPLGAVGGKSERNVFATGSASQIWHYNAQDWYRYPQFSGITTTFTSIWMNDEQVFVVGNDGFRTFVARGK